MHREPCHLSACCCYLSHWVVISEYDVACRQTERPVITLGSTRPLSKEGSPSKNSLEMAVRFELCAWGPRLEECGSVFIKREDRGSRSAEGACEGRARLQTSSAVRMCGVWGHIRLERTRRPLNLTGAQQGKHWNGREKFGCPTSVAVSLRITAEELLKRRIQGASVHLGIRLGNVRFEGVSSDFSGRRDLVLLSEKHCSRVISETLGEIAGREKPWAQDRMVGSLPGRRRNQRHSRSQLCSREQMIHAGTENPRSIQGLRQIIDKLKGRGFLPRI